MTRNGDFGYTIEHHMNDYAYLREKIREVQNYPTPGVNFKDIAPLLEDTGAFRDAIRGITDFFKGKKIDKVIGIESRGFLLASSTAYLLGAGLVMVRKKDKLPFKKITRAHSLEYGKGILEIHIDSVLPGEKVIVIDDVVATGGTAEAAIKLAETLRGEIVGAGFLLELPLGGREKLSRYDVRSLIRY